MPHIDTDDRPSWKHSAKVRLQRAVASSLQHFSDRQGAGWTRTRLQPNAPAVLETIRQLCGPAAPVTHVYEHVLPIAASTLQIYVLAHEGRPVALLPLRRVDEWVCQPLLDWVVPGHMFPAADGFVSQALDAAGLCVTAAWWRMGEPPKAGGRIREVKREPTFAMQCAADMEAYWKESGHLNTVKQARKKSSALRLDVDGRGAAALVNRLWAEEWRPFPEGDSRLDERIAAAESLEADGRHHTLTLWDGDKPVAGHTFVVDGEDLAWQVTFRDKAYDALKAGTYLMDQALQWARQAGYRSIDLGGSHDYKQRWGPVTSEKAVVTVVPEEVRRVLALTRRLGLD
jgi:hypothetical protein